MNAEELDQIIEKSLKTEPEFRLSANFTQKVVFKVVRRERWLTDLKEYLYLLGVLLSLLVVVSCFYYFIDKEFVLKAFTFVSENIIQVVLTVFLLNFIIFADKVLLRLLFSRWRLNN
jgi:hypothetical protein